MNEQEFKNELITMSPKCIQRLLFDYTKQKLETKETSHNNSFIMKDNANYCIRCSRLIKENDSNSYLQSLINSKKLFSSTQIDGRVCLNFQQIKEQADVIICYIFFDDVITAVSVNKEELKRDRKLGYLEYSHQGLTQGRFNISNNNLSYLTENYMTTFMTYEDLFEFASTYDSSR